MSARDVIEQALMKATHLPFGTRAVLEALTAAGYRLIGPDELDRVTVERCADLAKSFDERTDILKISGLGISIAIRKLTGGGNG